jgi:hypothetical protein
MLPKYKGYRIPFRRFFPIFRLFPPRGHRFPSRPPLPTGRRVCAVLSANGMPGALCHRGAGHFLQEMGGPAQAFHQDRPWRRKNSPGFPRAQYGPWSQPGWHAGEASGGNAAFAQLTLAQQKTPAGMPAGGQVPTRPSRRPANPRLAYGHGGPRHEPEPDPVRSPASVHLRPAQPRVLNSRWRLLERVQGHTRLLGCLCTQAELYRRGRRSPFAHLGGNRRLSIRLAATKDPSQEPEGPAVRRTAHRAG